MMIDAGGLDHQEDDSWLSAAVQTSKSQGDYDELALGSTPRPQRILKSRLSGAVDNDFSGDIIGDDLLPT